MKERKSSLTLSSRRGSSTDTTLTCWKALFLSSLLLLVGFLVRLNYQLAQELSMDQGTAAAVAVSGVAPSANDIEDEGAQKRLASLRKKVSTMKEKVGVMKGMVEDIKRQNAGMGSEFQPLTCTPETARKQAARMNKRFQEWWSHSACPDQVWMENVTNVFRREQGVVGGKGDGLKPFLILDIGCNKGYTSADFFDALSPGTNMNPKQLLNAIRAVARDMKTKFDRDGGVCNDANKPLNKDRKTERNVEVHCFEPSPATYNMLKAARSKLMNQEHKAKWHIHNVGLHEKNGQMSWHSACASSVGDELCTIVPDDTEGAVQVPVVTVDKFLENRYQEMPLVHMLKIDAEGLDPAVLTGSTRLLTQNRAAMVMFEFNPGLSEKDPPHGMWGKRGNPRKKLLEVTGWLDELGYDCYLDTHLVEKRESDKGVPVAPALYRITGDCITEEPRVRGWANVVCAARKFEDAALVLRKLATMV
ncbi:hypothetical protein ACHAWF_004468 [Thalassiosira exigua]